MKEYNHNDWMESLVHTIRRNKGQRLSVKIKGIKKWARWHAWYHDGEKWIPRRLWFCRARQKG